MDWLDMFLGSPTAVLKTPYLMLVGLRDRTQPERASADDVAGAVLLYEYRVAGKGVRVFSTDDVTGERTVIAPPEMRAEIAAAANQTLIERGAVLSMISFQGRLEEGWRPAHRLGGRSRMATRQRKVPRYLALGETLDDTLATLGNDTRRNFRRYRRRLESEIGIEFVPHVKISREAFLQMNRDSTNPVAEDISEWRYNALSSIARPVLCGIRDTNGRWLSLIGGRRRQGVLEIDWQLNRAGMERYSLSTSMRSFLIEHETALGTRSLFFEGGTPHPMRHSFVECDAVDIIAARTNSSRGWILSQFSRHIFPEKNFLGGALRDPELTWTHRY